MDCEQVQNLLSRFFDRELDRAEHESVERHVDACAGCRAELAALEQLSDAARSLTDPEPPADLWDRIIGQLAAQHVTREAAGQRRRALFRAAALAALVLIAVWTGWIAHGPGLRRGEQAASSIPAVDLGPYLDELAKSPRISVAPYGAVPSSPAEAARQVQFRVLNEAELPDNYALESGFLVRIEGCNVVQFKYLRGSDVVLLFQYSRGQPVAYGNRPVLATRINGKPAKVVQSDGCLCASWETNGTAVTLVGPRDMSELVRLVAFVDQHLMEDQR